MEDTKLAHHESAKIPTTIIVVLVVLVLALGVAAAMSWSKVRTRTPRSPKPKRSWNRTSTELPNADAIERQRTPKRRRCKNQSEDTQQNGGPSSRPSWTRPKRNSRLEKRLADATAATGALQTQLNDAKAGTTALQAKAVVAKAATEQLQKTFGGKAMIARIRSRRN